MKHKNWTNLIIALSLLVSSSIVMPQIQPVSHAASTDSSPRNPTDAVPYAKPVPDSGAPNQPTPATDPAMATLYPDDLDPPESCGMPLRGPFGQDVEILVGPGEEKRVTYQLYQDPSWYDQQPLPGSTPTSDVAAVAQGTEQIVAVWVGSGGGLFYNTWSASSGWSSSQSLNQSADGNPALLSRNAYNRVIFARVGSGIRYREWNYGTLGDWIDLEGVEGSASAASDPVVISKDPHHMAVFYRDAVGGVWFTEGMVGGGGTSNLSIQASAQVTTTIWRSPPVSLSGAEPFYEIYLPLVTKNLSGTSFASGVAAAHEPYTPSLGASDVFTLASELSVASRNENHLAVFGVDADNQLWVKEWTNHNESDWSDTAWVKLMENVNVMVERPAVASRHSNHLGVAVRDTSGAPWYIEWTYAAGWKTPVSLSGVRSSPLTMAAPRIDTLVIFSVEGGRIWHKDWRETEDWGQWQEFTDTDAQNGQILAATTRQMDDLMLLGRRADDGTGFYKHFTSLGRELSESVVAPGAPVSGWEGVQALAWVDGKMLWVGGGAAYPSIWKVDALALTDGVTATLALPPHPLFGEAPNGAMAAGDVDFDGDDEIIIATAAILTPTFSISVLNFAVSPTLVITLTSTVTHSVPDDSELTDVAIGDLDGDGRQDEVALTYSGPGLAAHISLFEYITTTSALEYRGHRRFTCPATGAWSTTGSMNTARYSHTATPLPGGRVLVAGGFSAGGFTASAEVYDLASDTWSTTGSMTTGRQSHTATPLPDGRVLVAGGNTVSGDFASAEVYDPASGTWSTTGSMTTGRTDHTATPLPDGRVLVTGGENSTGFLASAEVYDPATGAWSMTGSMTTGRGAHTATPLPDGRVLVAGGYNDSEILASAEVYDPGTGAWSTTGSMNIARYSHTATPLPDGRVLVAGGRGGSGILASAEVYDPATGAWSTTGSMTTARRSHTATPPDGRVLVAGGSGPLASAEVYVPATGAWSTAGSMTTARRSHTATLLPDGRVLVAGGYDGSEHLVSAEVYEPGISGDVRTAIGRVYDRHPDLGRVSGEQLIVASPCYRISPTRPYTLRIHTEVYSMTFTSPEWSFIEFPAIDGPRYTGEGWGFSEMDLSAGDLDADGLEEIVHARPGAVRVFDYDRVEGESREVLFDPENSDRVGRPIEAVGDVDQDGKAEIAYWTQDNRVAILDLVDGSTLHLSGSIAPTVDDGELLIGDLDGNSFQSELAGCASFDEVSVIAVLNGAPRPYTGGAPAQDTGVRYARVRTGGGSSTDGTTTNLGGFMSVGFEIEINVPLIGTKLGEVRGSVTQDFMASQGQTYSREESVTRENGYNGEGPTLGIVVYNETRYRCFYYDVYPPTMPAQKSRAMVCRLITETQENYHSLEEWHGGFREDAGASWVDVGHRTAGGVRTNNVNTYPSQLPIDSYLLTHIWDPEDPFYFKVDYDVMPDLYEDWRISQLQGTSQESSRSFETNTTVSAGATVGNVTVDAGVTAGFGWDESRSISWSDELEMGGAIYKISDPTFETCVYYVMPYIYHAKATTVAGVTYPYLEMDYYVPSLEGNCGALSSGQAVPSLSFGEPIPQ